MNPLAGARVLVTGGGGFIGSTISDLLVAEGNEVWLEAERIDTPNTHGTGCTLSAAIAAHLARGDDLERAVRAAKGFVTEAIRHALAIGAGIGPVDQLWATPRP